MRIILMKTEMHNLLNFLLLRLTTRQKRGLMASRNFQLAFDESRDSKHCRQSSIFGKK